MLSASSGGLGRQKHHDWSYNWKAELCLGNPALPRQWGLRWEPSEQGGLLPPPHSSELSPDLNTQRLEKGPVASLGAVGSWRDWKLGVFVAAADVLSSFCWSVTVQVMSVWNIREVRRGKREEVPHSRMEMVPSQLWEVLAVAQVCRDAGPISFLK